MDSNPLALIKTFLPEQAAVAAEKAVAHLPAKRRLSSPLVPLGQFPDPKPEEENPAALFKRGWLRKGGGAFIVAPSGVGKSVFTVQAAICWSLGKAAFGVEPVRPLKIAVIQAEDDREEVGYFRNCVTRGLVDEFGFSEADIRFALGWDDPATARVFFHKAVGKCGQAFVEEVGALLDERPDIDLVIVNPFQSYFGGDVNKNNELSAFFRMWLDPEIKDPGDGGNDRAAVMFMHHTNKPPNVKEREGWGVDMFAAYIGAGGAEIVNWARAILSLMPAKIPGMFRLCAGKRGQRLGWEDVSGKTSYCKVLKHAENGNVYWREGTPEDERELGIATDRADKEDRADVKQGFVEMLHAVLWDPGKGPYHYAKALAVPKEGGGLGCSEDTARNYLRLITAGARGSKYDWVEEKKTDFGNRFEATAEGRSAAMVHGSRLNIPKLLPVAKQQEVGF